jgi:lipoprotein-anchoring transpeptidase ErfK/SrfK
MGRRWTVVLRVAVASVAASTLILAGSGQVWSSEDAGPPSTARRTESQRPVGAPADIRSFRATAQLSQSSPAPEKSRPPRYLLVHVEGSMPITAKPGRGRTVGTMPAGSKYYHFPTVAWVREVSDNGKFGRVAVPYAGINRMGWVSLKGLRRSHTSLMVRVDLSAHRLTLLRKGNVVLRAPVGIGAPWSPTKPGAYFVTDRVPFSRYSSLGAFAFGISEIQTRLPAGWSGGNQLAIHGTNNPSSIGRSMSAGCVRVGHRVLMRLKPLLRLGTPVVIVR